MLVPSEPVVTHPASVITLNSAVASLSALSDRMLIVHLFFVFDLCSLIVTDVQVPCAVGSQGNHYDRHVFAYRRQDVQEPRW